ncbi:MAG: cytochrome bd ubiquinol oxidase subunit [Thermoleophilales bacterium]|nr:cytochrome bd ubiquinol oxidase subunit [Thermoleophilales bacterium]
MALADVPLVLILAGIAAYVVLGGADFGAGFWYFTAPGERGRALRDHTHHAMGPVWEANHVWLIFVLVIAWTAYPGAFGAIMSTLYVPFFIAAVGIILRGTTYAVRGWVTEWGEERVVGAIFGPSSVLTPFALGAAIGGIASGRVPADGAGDAVSSWLNPTSLTIGALAVATSAYLAANWLTADAARAGDESLVRAFRTRALVTGVLTGGLALAGLIVLHSDARRIFDGLTSGAGLAAVIASALAGAATLAFVARGRFEVARYSGAVAVAAIVAGWAIAQSPDLLPGLTVHQAAASHGTLVALLVAVPIGALILIPSLAWLFSLVLGGRFDEGPEEPGSTLRAAAGADGRPIGDGGLPAGALARAAVAVAVVGVGLMRAFDGGVGLGAGVVLLLAACALGAAAALPLVAAGGDQPS